MKLTHKNIYWCENSKDLFNRLNENQNINSTMNKIICIISVVIAIFSNVNAECPERRVKSRDPVCGSDGKRYHRLYFKCEQDTEYGKRVNLQFRHIGECFIWEEYGIETTTINIVS